MRRRRQELITKHSINQANSHDTGNITAICSPACRGVRGGGRGWREKMRRRKSCRVWMSQTGSIRGLTADGKSHHGATQVELALNLRGDWRYRTGDRDGKIEENKMVNWWESSVMHS